MFRFILTLICMFLAVPVFAQDKTDLIVSKLTSISVDLLELKKEQDARLKKAEQEISDLKVELEELKRQVKALKPPQVAQKVEENPLPPRKPTELPSKVDPSPKPSSPKVVNGTFQIVNTWNTVTVYVNGKLHKVPVGTTNIEVPVGKFKFQVMEIEGSPIRDAEMGAGEVWKYRIYPASSPPIPGRLTSLITENSPSTEISYINCSQPRRVIDDNIRLQQHCQRIQWLR